MRLSISARQGLALAFALTGWDLTSAAPAPAPQAFRQEIARTRLDALAEGQRAQLLDVTDGACRVFAGGIWTTVTDTGQAPRELLKCANDDEFVFSDEEGKPVRVSLPWRGVRQVVRGKRASAIVWSNQVYRASAGKLEPLAWPSSLAINQAALDPAGTPYVASSAGVHRLNAGGWEGLVIRDRSGRSWSELNALALTFDASGRLWVASRAGVACRKDDGWSFYEGKDGLPWNEFTWACAGPEGEVWFGTRLGAIRFENGQWHYRQGLRWLPNDEVQMVAVDPRGGAWFATAGGLGAIERSPTTLAAKAEHYEQEIERYVKRTSYGFVAEAPLKTPADKSSAAPHDSDNDGLWTAMYGAGECFAYAATGSPRSKERARAGFEALRFLQKVTQGGTPSPPKGYVARTIRPIDWPDPNIGRLEHDREAQKSDSLWKVYEPRWPKSADGKWFWKSDTSSDELDGHYFFYPLYFEFCADTEQERERVREVVRDLTDHLISHGFTLVDHDGRPTRWGIYGPEQLNRDPNWWLERGLKSLSMLSYLAVAEYVTGQAKYGQAARELIDRHGYAHNAMHPKVQHGPGAGNQSDDEMAFMCYYTLLRYSRDEPLKALMRYSLYRYWINEQPEVNPFFNFVCAAHNLASQTQNPWGSFPIPPWPGWQEDSMATLYGFPLDRLNWPHRNSHRLDIVGLSRVASIDAYELDRPGTRGHRVNGKVLPVENRHFGHWNTDPWRLDYGGNGNELAAGTVFLLPYYMGMYHGFIERPAK